MDGFSERLRDAMDLANMKAIELSEKTGINRSSISEYLAGSYEPKQVNIFKMAKALGVKPSYLMGVSSDTVSMPSEYKADAATKITIESGTPEYDLIQAYLRYPQRVQEEIMHRANRIDTTFAQNVSKMLKAYGHIDDFMKETGLSFNDVGKFMQGEPVRTTPEEAERIADYFQADIVDMFFDKEVSNFDEPPKDINKPERSPEWESIEELLDDEIVLAKEGSLARASFIALKKYLKNKPTASYDTTMSTIKMIKGNNFERWLGLALADIEAKQPHRFKTDDILFFIAKQLYEDPDGFIINYSRNAHTTKNLISDLLAEQKKSAKKGE